MDEIRKEARTDGSFVSRDEAEILRDELTAERSLSDELARALENWTKAYPYDDDARWEAEEALKTYKQRRES